MVIATILSALPIYRREVRSARGDVREVFSKRIVTIEGRAGTGKSSVIAAIPDFVLPVVDSGEVVEARVCVLNARMIGEPPISIEDVAVPGGVVQASQPLIWKPMVEAAAHALRGGLSVLGVEELYALPDHHASQLLYPLVGLPMMDRVAVVALTNPQDYYAEPLTLYPNLAQRFGFPLRGFDDDPMVKRLYEQYESGEYRGIRVPVVVSHRGMVKERTRQAQELIDYALAGKIFDQKSDEGKWVSTRTVSWCAEQLSCAYEILEMNDVDVWDRRLGQMVAEWREEPSIVPPSEITHQILQCRLGPVAAQEVMGVLSGLKPFPQKEFVRLVMREGVRGDELDRFIAEYVKTTPTRRLAELQIMRSLASLVLSTLKASYRRYASDKSGALAELRRLAGFVDRVSSLLGDVCFRGGAYPSTVVALSALMDNALAAGAVLTKPLGVPDLIDLVAPQTQAIYGRLTRGLDKLAVETQEEN